MKYDMTFKALGFVMNGVVKKKIPQRDICRKIRREYRAIAERAADIGAHNRLLGSYAMAAYFISMNRVDGLTAEENYNILAEGLPHSRLFKMAMGSGKTYFSEKNMESRRQWSRETYRREYKNDWVVDVLEKTDDYAFGFDYRECGACKLFRDEGCFQLAKYYCRLDFMTVEVMGIGLKRTMTIGDGFDHCDFRFIKKQ